MLGKEKSGATNHWPREHPGEMLSTYICSAHSQKRSDHTNTRQTIVYILERRKRASVRVLSRSSDPKFREPVPDLHPTCPSQRRGVFCISAGGLWILWLQRSHPVWVWYDVVSEDSVYQTVRAHKKDVNIQPTRHLKQIRDGEWFTVSDLHKEALGLIFDWNFLSKLKKKSDKSTLSSLMSE